MSARELPTDIKVNRRPLYLLAKDSLERLIEEEVFGPGDQLPSEPELAEMLGVSRGTLREALRIAQQEGLIVKRHGAGTFVTNHCTIAENALAAMESLDTLSQRRGWTCESIEVEIESRPLDEYVANTLDLEVGEMATYVSRVKLIEGERVAYVIDIVPHRYVPEEDVRQEFTGSVLDLLQERGDPELDHAFTYVLAVNADEEIAGKMGVPIAKSVLLTEETLYSVDQVPVEFSYNYFLSDFFNFFVIRSLG
jgi:GntR family transcriptional regulator